MSHRPRAVSVHGRVRPTFVGVSARYLLFFWRRPVLARVKRLDGEPFLAGANESLAHILTLELLGSLLLPVWIEVRKWAG